MYSTLKYFTKKNILKKTERGETNTVTVKSAQFATHSDSGILILHHYYFKKMFEYQYASFGRLPTKNLFHFSLFVVFTLKG